MALLTTVRTAEQQSPHVSPRRSCQFRGLAPGQLEPRHGELRRHRPPWLHPGSGTAGRVAAHYVAQTTVFGTQSQLGEACAVASRVAGRTIVPGGPKQHVRDQYITLFIVCAVSGLDGARLGVGDNLVHIQLRTTSKTRA